MIDLFLKIEAKKKLCMPIENAGSFPQEQVPRILSSVFLILFRGVAQFPYIHSGHKN